IPFLNQGREGIGALTAEADRLGVTISGTTANAAGAFNDTLDRLTATFSGGALGVIASGWLMTRFGWHGIVALGIALGLAAAAIHRFGTPSGSKA
ncbi:MAG: hypothetical protein V4641_00945, partial [Pseudomonadota bacterium]